MFFESGNFDGMNYLVHFPDGYKEGEKYPVLLMLHGAGTRGITLEQYQKSPSFANISKAAGDKLIIVAPHCTNTFWYDIYETLVRFAKKMATAPFTDPTRYYLCGAIVPICGGGMHWTASRLVNLPIWAFHGAKDTTVLPEESQRMVDRVNYKGGNAKLTIYPDNAHDAWSDTYSNPEVFAWLLSHENKNPPILQDECQGMKEFG